MKLSIRILVTAVCALALAVAFNLFFLRLDERPRTDQILLVVISAAASGWLIFPLWGRGLNLRLPRFEAVNPRAFFKEHAPGILLALTFLAVYLFIGLRLNFPDNDTTDNFLDADNFPWMRRIASPLGYEYEMRGPHPFAYFVFRPLGWTLNLFTQDFAASAIFLNALAGALCVLLAWMIVKHHAQDSAYSLLFATLLGLSAAHIFLGSVVETYIFSAAALLLFVLLIQRQSSVGALVGISLLTFGITLTNFVQNFIAYGVEAFKASKNWKEYLGSLVRFAGLTLSIGILLTLLHAAVYPSSKIFFLLADNQGEKDFAFSIFTDPSWRVVGRLVLLARTVLLYAIIAPKPYAFVGVDGGDFPRFNFFKIVPGTFSYSSYDGLGNVLVMAWALLLLAAGIMFLVNLARTKKADLTLTFALCVLFNFVLHINYGYEPFLYSPDWAYALILFVALALAPFAKQRLLQGGLLLFLVALAYNQAVFFQFIFATIRPFLK